MQVKLYPDIIHKADLSPDAFGPKIDEVCKEIHEACKGWGTNEKRLIKALASQNGDARTKISARYKVIYGKDLKAVMDKECGGDLGTALEFLAVPPDVAECDMINKACSGAGTNERVLYPIICGRTNAEMNILKKTYFKIYTKDLGMVLNSELGGNYEQLIFNCLQGSEEGHDAAYHTDAKAKEDVALIYKAGQGKFGTDEASLFKIICASPPAYLKKVNLMYAEKHGYTLEKALEKELGGKTREAAVFLLGMKLKPYETVAELIKESCAGFGTNELLLTCTLIRYQGILKHVMQAHIELFGKTVQDRVRDETKGDLEALLLQVCEAAGTN